MPVTKCMEICVVGNQHVGKTDFIKRFNGGDSFDHNTNRASNAIKLNLNKIETQLEISEVPGYVKVEYSVLTVFSIGCMLLFDITNEQSFTAVPTWLHALIRKVDPIKNVLLVGAKCDLECDRVISYDQGAKLADKLGIRYIEASAKAGYNINEAFKMLLGEYFKTSCVQIHRDSGEVCIQIKAQIRIMSGVEDETERGIQQHINGKIKLLQQNLDKAKRLHKTIPVRFVKILLTGSGAAGKTSFRNLLLKRKFSTEYHSTDIAHTNHTMSVSKAVIQSSAVKKEVTWIGLNFDLQIYHLHSVLLSTCESPFGVQQSTVQQLPQSNVNRVQPNYTACRQSITKFDVIKQWFAKLFNSDLVKREHLLTFHDILDNSLFQKSEDSSDTLVYQPDEVLNIITLLDTGGQPEFIHLLPTINIYHTVNFIVHDLTKKLDDQVLVKYSQHGKQMITPYHLNYSNIDMIKLLMSAVNGAAETQTFRKPQLASIPITDQNSYLCLVGTHADQVTSDIIDDTAGHLNNIVDKLKCQAKVWHNANGSVLFPVDNTTAGSANEDPVAAIIRNKIEQISSTKDIYDVPVTWMLLELEIQKFCTKEKRSSMLFEECAMLAKSSGLIPDIEEVKNVLRYYHQLGILLYYEEVPGLCDFIITDHQWFFDKLSSIVYLTFQGESSNHHAIQKLKYQGLLSKELFQHVDWTDTIKKEFFLLLLVHMKIIAPVIVDQSEDGFCVVDEEEYFIPFILPTYPSMQKNDHLFHYGYMQGEPLLIRFQSGLLPRGVFCCLVVELLQKPPAGWHPHFSKGDTHHTFSNLITFSLPNAYSLTLFDGVSHLKAQIRHPEENFHCIHIEVYKSLVQALTEVCQHLNFDHNRLQYGFLCQSCSDNPDDHIAIVPVLTPSLCYAECSINSTHHVPVTSSHLMWFFQSEAISGCVKDKHSSNSTQTNDFEHTPELTAASYDHDQPAMKRPVMRVLHDIVIPRVAAHWSVLADYLEYELEYKQLIQKKCNSDPLECCVMLLEDWLSSKRGVSPKSWRVLIKVLREIKVLMSAAEKIEEDLLSAGVELS